MQHIRENFLCQFSYFLAGAFSFNKDELRFFFTFFWNRFWEFWHRRNNLSCYCRNNFSALLLCHYSLYLRCSQSKRQSQKNWRTDGNDCVATLCVHIMCRLHLDAIRLYLESVDIGFDITHCHSSRHQKWSPQWSSHPQHAARSRKFCGHSTFSFLGWRHFPATVNPPWKSDFYALQKPRPWNIWLQQSQPWFWWGVQWNSNQRSKIWDVKDAARWT